MAVLLSMLTYVPGGMGGSETYARELVRALGERGADARILVPPAARGVLTGLPEQVAEEWAGDRSAVHRTAEMARRAVLPGALRQRLRGADVVHHPFTVPVPRPLPGQGHVLSLLDVQHLDLPHLFSRAERAYRRLAYDRAARRADVVVTISAFSRDRIVHHLGIDPARVVVAPLGVRPEPAGDPVPREPFLLYPARGWAHKDHAGLFAAVPLLRRQRPDLRVVLTGARAEELPPLPAGVELRGHVTRAELLELYRRAAALVFPSRYEGFGLPVLEAMAAGCPVAAARSGALAEVVGDAGVLFDAGDPEALVAGVLEALDRADELSAAGPAHAQRWTWDACAAAHERAYAQAVPRA